MSQDATGSVLQDVPSYPDSLDWSFIEPIPEFPDATEWYQPGIFDINMPIHPTYKKWLNPILEVGDLVESYNGDIGIIVEIREPEGISLRINDANNNSYTVLVGDKEEVFIGYSLRRVEKKS